MRFPREQNLRASGCSPEALSGGDGFSCSLTPGHDPRASQLMLTVEYRKVERKKQTATTKDNQDIAKGRGIKQEKLVKEQVKVRI